MTIHTTAAKFHAANDIDGMRIATEARRKFGHNAWMCALVECRSKPKPTVKPVEEIKPEPIQADTRKIDMRPIPTPSGLTASGVKKRKSDISILDM